MKLILGDCLEELKKLPDNSVDSIVTDPPYGLEFMGKDWDAPWKGKPSKEFNTSCEGKLGGFKSLPNHSRVNNIQCQKCGKWKFSGNPCTCDEPDFPNARLMAMKGLEDFTFQWATECLRVLKPGGHLISFGGTRTYHRMAVAIEDAGFEVRDMIEWVYNQGFPKSLNVFKNLTKQCTCGNMEAYEKRIQQMGKRSQEDTEYDLRCLSESHLSQDFATKEEQAEVLQSSMRREILSGTLPRNKQGEKPKEKPLGKEKSCLERRDNLQKTEGELQGSKVCKMPKGLFADGEERRIHNGTQIDNGTISKPTIITNRSNTPQRPQSLKQPHREPCAFCKQWGAQALRTYGFGSAIKPAHEPIILARKPLECKTVVENVLKHGVGAIDIDGCRIPTGEISKRTPGYKEPQSRMNTTSEWNKSSLGLRREVDTKQGRFPANCIVTGDALNDGTTTTPSFRKGNRVSNNDGIVPWNKGRENGREVVNAGFTDSGSKSRYFDIECWGEKWGILQFPKASKRDRGKGNIHPTCKPTHLLAWLIRLVTPPSGTCLDPFAGSFTTGVACKMLGRDFIGIERESDYYAIGKARIDNCKIEPDLFGGDK